MQSAIGLQSFRLRGGDLGTVSQAVPSGAGGLQHSQPSQVQRWLLSNEPREWLNFAMGVRVVILQPRIFNCIGGLILLLNEPAFLLH